MGSTRWTRSKTQPLVREYERLARLPPQPKTVTVTEIGRALAGDRSDQHFDVSKLQFAAEPASPDELDIEPSPMRSPSLSSTTPPRVSANAVFDAPLRRHAGVVLDQAGLNLDRAAHRVDRAAELDDCAVAMALDDAAAMGGDGRVDQIAAKIPTARKRPVVVGAGEPAVADWNGSTLSHLSREERPLRGAFLPFPDRAGKAAKGRLPPSEVRKSGHSAVA
jgi:hypothetical protein